MKTMSINKIPEHSHDFNPTFESDHEDHQSTKRRKLNDDRWTHVTPEFVHKLPNGINRLSLYKKKVQS